MTLTLFPMKISIKVNYVVWVKAKAIEGEANQAVIKILSKHLNLPKSKIILIKGKTARDKVFMVDI